MKKFYSVFLILIMIGLLGFADYYFNFPNGLANIVQKQEIKEVRESNTVHTSASKITNTTPDTNITQKIIESYSNGNYKIKERNRSKELFEKFDLSELANISIYKNELFSKDKNDSIPIYIYEINSPKGQGGITYLNIKMSMIKQNSSEENINENKDYGQASLFFNNPANKTTAYLLVQIQDLIFGFQYNKKSSKSFDFIKTLVNNYTAQFSNNF